MKHQFKIPSSGFKILSPLVADIKAFAFLFFALSFSCTSSGKDERTMQAQGEVKTWTITIRGKVASPQQGKITIEELNDGSGSAGWQDTITLKSNSTFSKKVTLSEPGYYRINFYDRQRLNVILDKSDLEVNVDGSNPQGFFEVKGSPDMELIQQVQSILSGFNNSPALVKLNNDFNAAAQQKNEAQKAALQNQYQTLMNAEHDKIARMMEQHSPSLAVINLLQSNTIDKDRYFNTYVTVAETLKKQWPDYTQAKAFIAMVDKMKKTAIGQPAPEIALPDPDGKIVTLSSMKGQYVLVDFWAKWCGPCRQENPNVVRVYNKYKDKGFTVFGVSLDRRKEDWLQAIQEDGLTWTHVSDLKFWQSEAAKTYNINAIPFSLLLDPNGVIIDKNLRGSALDKRLAEIFDKKD